MFQLFTYKFCSLILTNTFFNTFSHKHCKKKINKSELIINIENFVKKKFKQVVIFNYIKSPYL